MAEPRVVDPHDPVMTGENSFVRLSHDGGNTIPERVSHWRVLWSPAGQGHALYIESTLLGSQPKIYADNAGVARFLQRTIETLLAWWDLIAPFVLTMPPGAMGRPLGVYSTFIPARSAQLSVNGQAAPGKVFPQERGGRPSSSCVLAWSETWTKPRG